ncbi:MAG: glutamate racemase [Actinomycetota bacterium]|nr:glutamate racemase [Actinomycetota bacterium]
MAPIGIFDSGVGGLSVLREFRRLAPDHPVIYLADQAWSPYGERSLDAVRQRSVAITRFLVDQGCELIVVACNSASAAALHHLREVFPTVLFVGMEPAVKPAASQSERGVIGVLATSATFQGELYASVVDRHANGAEVVEQACPGLADAVERLGADAPETIELVTRYVAPLREAGVDTLVLGCTHYPFLLPTIERLVGDIVVIDPSPAVARQVLRLLRDLDTGGVTTFLTTGEPATFADQIETLLEIAARPHRVDIEGRGVLVSGATVTIVNGDLTVQDVDAVVNAANDTLQHGGGVAAALANAGGPIVQEESDEWIRRHGPVPTGGAAITTAGTMPADHVIHVVGPIYRNGQDNEGLLRAAVVGALDAAIEIEAKSVAFPAISAGVYGYPITEATAILADEIVRWLRLNPGTVDEVMLIGFNPVATDHLARGLVAAIAT